MSDTYITRGDSIGHNVLYNSYMNVEGNDQNIKKLPPSNGDRYKLSARSELRLEIPANTYVTLTLLTGSAEIFGAEMAPDYSLTSLNSVDIPKGRVSSPFYASKQSYIVRGHTKLAIFTWHGCTLDVDVELGRSLDISYTSSETSANIAYLNVHSYLEALRDEALSTGNGLSMSAKNISATTIQDVKNSEPLSDTKIKTSIGPRVILVGPADSGKTSLARVLTSYAIKMGRNPILVDLDVSQNILSVPGTFAYATMTWDSISVTTHSEGGNSIALCKDPVVFWYGSTDPSSNPNLYKMQLDALARSLDQRLNHYGVINMTKEKSYSTKSDVRASGIIVNTSWWIEDKGYQLLLHAVLTLKINIILVIGHDRLYSMLQSHFSKGFTTEFAYQHNKTSLSNAVPKIMKLPRSGGVVSRDSSFRRISRNISINRYFHGDIVRSKNREIMSNQYTPSLQEHTISKLILYKMSKVSLTESMLPVSAKQTTEPLELVTVEFGPSLLHSVLAVCSFKAVKKYGETGNASYLYLSTIAGFVVVEKVDMLKKIISFLSPSVDPLPSNVLLMGDLTWTE